MKSIEITVLIALIGCFVGLAGWLSVREKRIMQDGEWKGTVNNQLTNIAGGIDSIRCEFGGLKETVATHGERLTAVEGSCKAAHKRLDSLEKEEKR